MCDICRQISLYPRQVPTGCSSDFFPPNGIYQPLLVFPSNNTTLLLAGVAITLKLCCCVTLLTDEALRRQFFFVSLLVLLILLHTVFFFFFLWHQVSSAHASCACFKLRLRLQNSPRCTGGKCWLSFCVCKSYVTCDCVCG